MARKRMISPSIWGSLSFSKLSDFAKLVFIGLFSNADDEGKGCADVSMIKSTLFPRDKQRRLTDIENALSEIAQNMSIKFYEIEGDSYYILTAWQKWQTINRPTPSIIPNPPATMGERGRSTQNCDFNDNSLNTHGVLTEYSVSNIKEEKGKEINNISLSACAREDMPFKPEEYQAFIGKYNIIDMPSVGGKLCEMDFKRIDEAYGRSKYLRTNKRPRYLKFISAHYDEIITGYYEDNIDTAKVTDDDEETLPGELRL